jgi:hypothetical protein
MIRPKHIKKVFRDIELKTAYLQIPFLFTNHVYVSQGSFISMDIIAGGSGVLYSADIISAITKAKWRISDRTVGVILSSNMFKNRHAKENTRIKIKISYEKGLLPYSGLFEWCVDNKIFKDSGDIDSTNSFQSFKDKKKGNKSKKYIFSSSTGDIIVTEKMCDNEPEKIFTEENLKIIDKEISKYFSYGSEYTEEKESVKEDVSLDEISSNEIDNTIKNEIINKKETPKEIPKENIKKRRGRPVKK